MNKYHICNLNLPTNQPFRSLCGKPFVWLGTPESATCKQCKKIHDINTRISKIQNSLKENCSGSGIDCEWKFESNKNILYASNSYHTMDEYGGYDGYADFTIRIDVFNPINFKLHFNGKKAQYLNRKYMLREYLDDTFAEHLRKF